jgi:predicted component of type VI protein secretion system
VQSETYIVSECLEWLAVNGIFAWRNNTGAIKVEGRFIKYGKIGSADILGVLPDGRHLEIECKTETGTQEPEQIIHERKVKKNNGVYLLVRSLKELQNNFTFFLDQPQNMR